MTYLLFLFSSLPSLITNMPKTTAQNCLSTYTSMMRVTKKGRPYTKVNNNKNLKNGVSL